MDDNLPAVMMSSFVCVSVCAGCMCMMMLLRRGGTATPGSILFQSSETRAPRVVVSKSSGTYGGKGGNPFEGKCPKNYWVASLVAYSKNGDSVDGIYADCMDSNKTLVPLITTGDRHGDGVAGQSQGKKANKLLTDMANTVISLTNSGTQMGGFSALAIDPLKGGRQQYTTGGTVGEDGFNKMETWVRPLPGKLEVGGIRFTTVGGNSDFVGGQGGKDGKSPPWKKYTFECPRGSVLTGIRGRAGERVDAIQYRCTNPFA